jgi:hypothetical protein
MQNLEKVVVCKKLGSQLGKKRRALQTITKNNLQTNDNSFDLYLSRRKNPKLQLQKNISLTANQKLTKLIERLRKDCYYLKSNKEIMRSFFIGIESIRSEM